MANVLPKEKQVAVIAPAEVGRSKGSNFRGGFQELFRTGQRISVLVQASRKRGVHAMESSPSSLADQLVFFDRERVVIDEGP